LGRLNGFHLNPDRLMAEIHIEKKDRPVWPWILGAILLALLLWYLFAGRRGDPRATDTVAFGDTAAWTSDTAVTGGGAMQDFIQFADDRAAANAGQAHDYAADGLRRLAAAIEALLAERRVEGLDASQRTAEIRQRADSIQRDPAARDHAGQVREAFMLAGGALRQIQEQRFSGVREPVREVNDAAGRIAADRPLLDQRDAMQNFFSRAANALRGMSRAS
jgi:hypothetical protein